MNFFKKIPGPFLVFLGACALSFGGLIVKSFEGANLWQILFWRSVFFSIVVLFFLLLNYKKNLFISIYKIGLPGFFGGLIGSMVFEPLLVLQVLQEVTIFSQLVSPPFDLGTT